MMQRETTAAEPVYERRALILDDNDSNRMLLKFVMQLNGIDHDEASTAQEALQIWRRGAYSFAFLDIELPDRSGLEVARQMRAADDGLAIIMCSTNDDPHIVAIAVKGGCDMFLVKPFQLDTLMTLVKTMDRVSLRVAAKVLIIDNTARSRWEARPRQLMSTV